MSRLNGRNDDNDTNNNNSSRHDGRNYDHDNKTITETIVIEMMKEIVTMIILIDTIWYFLLYIASEAMAQSKVRKFSH